LKTALETTITVCKSCHEKYVTKDTLHPLQVGPKTGMVFPEELFVLGDGTIACLTCHQPHSSYNSKRLVKGDPNELCLGCHTDHKY
jgi:predicted CXXCH cytochrome family protein